ncbi:MAG: nitroreductase family protein [Oscillospiraceae bacterium]|nr:nitroreductase family protein [Oscillospiraceae bacterium]MBR7085532.1 nitroreductase family protein [Oscillospiraceae bacterium]
MEFTEVLQNRRSIRQYTSQPVTQEQMEEIIALARFAPSWKNSQTAKYYVILNQELKNQIAEQGTCDFSKNKINIQNAPCLVVLATVDKIAGYNHDGSFTTSKETHWQSFDAGIACQTFCLTAFEKGLGTLIMGIYDEEKIKTLLNLPENESISALIAVGYETAHPDTPPRKELEKIMQIL